MWEQSGTFWSSLYLKHAFEWMSAPISLLCKTLMVFCVTEFVSSLVGSCVSSLSSVFSLESRNQAQYQEKWVWTFRACRSAARMWLAVSSPSCTSALHSVRPGMTGIPVKRASVKTFLQEPPVPRPGYRERNTGRLTSCHFLMFGSDTERSARPLLMWIYLLRKVRFGPGQFVVVSYIRQYNHGASWCLQTGKSRCNWWVIKGKEIKSWQTRQIYRWSWIF